MAAASGDASSEGANDDAVPGRCCERRPWVSRAGRVGPDAWVGLRVWRATLIAKYKVIVVAESELRVGIGLIKAIDWPNERSAHYSKPGR